MPRMMAIGMIKMDRKSVVTRLNFSLVVDVECRRIRLV